MRATRFSSMPLLLLSFFLFLATSVNQDKEILIKFKPSASAEMQDSLAKSLGLEHVKSLDAIQVQKFRITSEQSVTEIVQLCSNVSFIEYAEATQAVRAMEAGAPSAQPEPEPIARQAELPAYKPGEFIVKFKPTADQGRLQSVLEEGGAIQFLSLNSAVNVHRCKVVGDKSVLQAVEECKANPDIEYAEPNYIYHASVEPNDSQWSSLYGMRQISAPAAWDVQTGSKTIVVGVVDTGVDAEHEDLAANIWHNPGETGGGKENNGVDDDGNGFVDDHTGWDFVSNDNNAFDQNRHGTHCSGTIGAVGNNSRGVAGVNWNVSIMPLRFLDADGSGTTSDALEAIIYGADNGAKILSNSWGGGGKSQALEDAIKYARDKGVIFVAAAGNESSNNDRSPTYPANYEVDNVVTVASNTSSDNLSSFSNYGETTVDLSAPGSSILSTVPRDRYESLSGTSMATPHVSGAAALIWSQFPSLNMHEVIIRLLGSVDKRAAYADKTITGGRLNVHAALSTSPIIARTTRLQNTLDEAGPYVVEADVIDDSAVQTVSLTYQVTGQTAISVNMADQGEHHYKGEIPGQPLASTVVYFVSAEDDDGNSTRDSNHTFSIAEPSGDGSCCGKPAIDFDIDNKVARTSVNAVANASIFIFPILVWGIRGRQRNRKK